LAAGFIQIEYGIDEFPLRMGLKMFPAFFSAKKRFEERLLGICYIGTVAHTLLSAFLAFY
jgi:hypothetical protein